MHRAVITRPLSRSRGGPLTGLLDDRKLLMRWESIGGAQQGHPVGANVAVPLVRDARVAASMDLVDGALEKRVRASELAVKVGCLQASMDGCSTDNDCCSGLVCQNGTCKCPMGLPVVAGSLPVTWL